MADTLLDPGGSDQSFQVRSPLQKSGRYLAFVFIWAMVLFIMFASFQRWLIYHPTTSARLEARNSQLRQAVADVQIKSADNQTLHGWLALAGQRATANPDITTQLAAGRPLVLVFPGNGGHRAMREYLMDALGSVGADVMIFDYRGFAENTGKPTERLLIQDARSIWDYATKDLKVPATRIVLYGESLGGGVATRLAHDLCTNGTEPGGLVIQASFNSLVEAGQYHFPLVPVSLILVDRFESERYIASVTCPILHLHGKLDQVVPVELGQKLFEAAPDKSTSGVAKQFVMLPRANHNDVYGADLTLVMQAVTKFLSNVKTAIKPAAVP